LWRESGTKSEGRGIFVGLLYSGFLTANETAAIGVGLVLIYGLVWRRLSFENLLEAAADTARTCGALYLVVIGANLFDFFLALTGVPFSMTSLLGDFVSNPLLLIIMMTIIYLVIGCLMDSLAMVLLTVPLFVPIVQAAGIDPIWFGIDVVMVVELGLFTPPVGMNLFVTRASHEGLRLPLAMGHATTADAREMRFSSWESAQGFLSSKILQAWIHEVNSQLSDGASFKLYLGVILGAPPAQQELIKKGVADVAMVGPTQTPGLFPLSTIVEVPFLAQNSANGTKICKRFWTMASSARNTRISRLSACSPRRPSTR